MTFIQSSWPKPTYLYESSLNQKSIIKFNNNNHSLTKLPKMYIEQHCAYLVFWVLILTITKKILYRI